MVVQIMRNSKQTSLLAISLWLSGCTGVISLSEEEPYASMIGECYVLQQEMRIRENVCWDLGDLILSPDESEACLRDIASEIVSETKITLIDVRRRSFGSFGFCPEITVDIDGIELSGREVSLPLCLSRSYMSWLEEPLWRRGDEIHLKEEYVLPCTD